MRIKLLSRCGIEHNLPADKTIRFRPGWEFVHSRACIDYDWLVVFDEMPPEEVVRCPRENTMLLTWEPVSIKSYPDVYTRQFARLLTNRPREAEHFHPGYRLGCGYFPAFTGRGIFDDIAFVAPPKDKLISVVCSAKQMSHTSHAARYRLVSYLSKQLNELDWYGHGVRKLKVKTDALDAYKYHVAVENHIAPYHWSEKIADAFLCECLPFYAGDPKLGEVLPPESFIPIPIDDPVSAARIIREAIETNQYEKRLPAIREARRLIQERYNVYAQIIEAIEAVGSAPMTEGFRPWKLYSRRHLRLVRPFASLASAVKGLFR